MVLKNTNPIFWRSTPGPNSSNHRYSYFPAALPFVATCILLTTLLLIIAVPTAAQMNTQEIDSVIRNPKLPWQLEADRIDYDQKTDEYTATGNVLIYKGKIRLLADFVRFDRKNMKAYAEGNVVLTNGEDVLSGERMNINLQNQLGSVEDGYLFLKANNYHLTGNVIKKVGPKTYTIDEATITCVTPAHAVGAVDVEVTNSYGSDILPGAFRYHNPPDILSLSPDSGPPMGGTFVAITGTDFTTDATVDFGGVPAFSLTFVNSTSGTHSSKNTSSDTLSPSSEKVVLTNIPTSTDSQVDQRQIWRTASGGV